VDRAGALPAISFLYGAARVDTIVSEILSGDIRYYQYWMEDQQGAIRFSFLMGMVQCYALPDTGSGRFPWSLLPIIVDMMQHGTVYAWAPTLLAQIYRELFFYSQGHRASLSVTITLQAWAYEHIAVARPPGLPMPGFGSHLDHEAGIVRWRDDFYIRPSDGVRRDVGYYRHMLSHLTPGQVRFRPYRSYPVWGELAAELTGIRQPRVLSGRRTDFLEFFHFERVRRQFGLVQDVPAPAVPYQREGTISAEGVQSLVYVEPDPTQEEGLLEDDIGEDDVGVSEAFSAWWQVELEEGDDGLEGGLAVRRVRQRVDIAEGSGAAGEREVGEEPMGAEAAGEEVAGEEAMMDAPEELAPEEEVEGAGAGGAAPEVTRRVDDAPATQVPSIDSLLGDIYELRYQLAQANSRMYRYRAERDRYRQERDEARSSLQGAQAHQLGAASTSGGSTAFIHGICQQRDFYSGIVQTWLTGVPAFTPGAQYPLPPASYMPIDISAYQTGSGAQGTVGSPGRMQRSRGSPSRSGTPWASPLGAVGSSELRGAQRPGSPTTSVGTTPPGQGTGETSRRRR